MTIGTGQYMNPRDGDVVECDIEVTGPDVRVTRWEVRGCDAAKRATAEISRHVRYDAADDVVRIAFGSLLAALRPGPDEERCVLTVVNALQAALADAETQELA